jgi:ribosomal protein S18 acetylase RimI-like enzyme
VTQYRPFRNTDPPALVEIWNQGLPELGVVKPLTVHEFDALIVAKEGFEVDGLIVAERDGAPVAFIHAGFGPAQPEGPSHRLDHDLGTIAMLVVAPGRADAEIERALVLAAERYLRSRGAKVLYAGGQFPVNPFYWGLYGASEFAGILSAHVAFERAVTAAGYESVARSLVLELDLSNPESRDPRIALLRRQVRIEIVEDVLPSGWWEAQAIGLFRPTRFRLLGRNDGVEIAHAKTWDIACGFGVGDGRPRAGLIDVEVAPEFRRKGFGRLLLTEVFRHARQQLTEIVTVQTAETNEAARGLYEALGFEPVEVASLFRLPAELNARSVANGP